jgi:ribonuclease HII
MSTLYDFDKAYLKALGIKYIIGIDEAGRGPLAGPILTAAAILNLEDVIQGVNDSKKLSEKKRDSLFKEIYLKAVYKKAVAVSEDAIEKYNVRNATIRGMEECLTGWKYLEESYVIVDGDLILGSIPLEKQEAVVKGDAKSASIAAASIIAKVSRDQIMKRFAKLYPEYLFEKHKGYGTKDHINLIGRYGLCPIHRVSFCKKFVR